MLTEILGFVSLLTASLAIAYSVKLFCDHVLPHLMESTEQQKELAEVFHRNAMIFMKNADPSKYERERDMIMEIAENLMERGWFLKVIVRGQVYADKLSPNERARRRKLTAERIDEMPDNVRQAFETALGSAMTLSIERSIFSTFHRITVALGTDEQTHRITESEQVVFRFRQTRKNDFNDDNTACA